MQVHKILIPLDTSARSGQILPAVRDLFAPDKSELTLLSVVTLVVEAPRHAQSESTTSLTSEIPTFDQEAWQRQVKQAEVLLRAEAQELDAASYQVKTVVRSGDPVQEIIATLEEGNYDLLAMATHGETGSERQLLGSVAERVLRRVHMPLLLLRPFAQSAVETTLRHQSLPAPAAGRVMALATATDGSTHAQRARILAQSLARAFQADLNVIVVADEHGGAAEAQQLMQDVQQRLGDWALAVELTPLVGRTDIVLERYLSEHPVDLLVIGAFKDRDAGASAHIGFTAQQVVQHIPVSILVAKGYQSKLRKLLAVVANNGQPVIEVAARWAKVLGAELQFLVLLPPAEKQPESDAPQLADLPLNEILVHGLFRHEASLAEQIKTVALEAALSNETPEAQFIKSVLPRMNAVGVERRALLVRRGPTVRTILYMAEQEHADLIIVGSQVERVSFLDSTASAVLQLAPCSVLVVRSKQE